MIKIIFVHSLLAGKSQSQERALHLRALHLLVLLQAASDPNPISSILAFHPPKARSLAALVFHEKFSNARRDL